jgi:putative lysine transport system substrate-binding protein
MRKKSVITLALAGVMAASLLSGCGSSASSSETTSESTSTADSSSSADSSSAADSSSTDDSSSSERGVLRVGMECAYAPFNWTQDSDTTPDGSTAVPIYGSDYYAYGYDVAVAQMIADELDMDLEVHKVEWSSIGISMDAGDYDCIIAGMGKTAEREASYSFTEPYYYRDNCIVVKKDGAYSDVKGLSDLANTGCKVTTQLGTGWVPLLDQIEGGVQAGNYETTSECFMAISNGTADVCIVDLPTAESAALTNDDLQIITLDEDDGFTGDDEMVNVCIATRKDDTELRDKIQGAMDSIGWNDKTKMDELMDTVLTQQPAAN